jgi:hypothetical protein
MPMAIASCFNVNFVDAKVLFTNTERLPVETITKIIKFDLQFVSKKFVWKLYYFILVVNTCAKLCKILLPI